MSKETHSLEQLYNYKYRMLHHTGNIYIRTCRNKSFYQAIELEDSYQEASYW